MGNHAFILGVLGKRLGYGYHFATFILMGGGGVIVLLFLL